MKMALCGQLGAGCTEVATLISRKRGSKVVNSELIIRRLVAQGPSSFADLQEHVSSGEINLDRVLEGFTVELAEAEEDIIVEGRSALFLLPRKGFFKVLLVADDEFRTRRISNRRGISLEEAKVLMKHSDEERESLVRRFYGLYWLHPSLYHLVVNTSLGDDERIAEVIFKAYEEVYAR